MIPESIKTQLVNSLRSALTFTLNGKGYTVVRTRQNQSNRLIYPRVVITFLEEIPTEMFLGGRIGTYTFEDGSQVSLKGWVEQDTIYFDIYARDHPDTGEFNGVPLVDQIGQILKDYILTHWDHDVLMGNGMSLVEPVSPVRYVNDFTGPEYSHRKTLNVRINTNYYYPRFEPQPSMNTTLLQLDIGLQEVGESGTPTRFTLPTTT